MATKVTINFNELKEMAILLNETEGIPGRKLKTVGVTKVELVKSFINKVNKMDDTGMKIPKDIVDFYNKVVEDRENELKKDKEKKKKERGPRTPKNGITYETCALIKKNPNISVTDAIEKISVIFPDKKPTCVVKNVHYVLSVFNRIS